MYLSYFQFEFNSKRIFLTFFLTLVVGFANAQDPLFSQFMNNPVQLNPALAGSNHGCPRLNFAFRRQHTHNTTNYIVRTMSSDRYIDRLKSGISFEISNDILGSNVMVKNALNLGYAYHQKLSKNFFYC